MAAPQPKVDVDERMRQHVANLNAEYQDVKRDDSDEGRRQRAQVTAKLIRLTHDQIHPGEELVELDMPTAVQGEPFKINEEVYGPGRVIVPACVAQTLLWMIDQNRQIDLRRMQESGRTMNLGVLAERARAIGQED